MASNATPASEYRIRLVPARTGDPRTRLYALYYAPDASQDYASPVPAPQFGSMADARQWCQHYYHCDCTPDRV